MWADPITAFPMEVEACPQSPLRHCSHARHRAHLISISLHLPPLHTEKDSVRSVEMVRMIKGPATWQVL